MKVNVEVKVNMKGDDGQEVFYDDEDIVSVASIIRAVSNVFMVDESTLKCKRRPAYVARARQAMYYLCWLKTRSSLPRIGEMVERDHTTVLWGRNRCIQLMRQNDMYKDMVVMAKELAEQYEAEKKREAREGAEEIKRKIEEALEERSSNVERPCFASGVEAIGNIVHSEG
jgi:hypothetical protein